MSVLDEGEYTVKSVGISQRDHSWSSVLVKFHEVKFVIHVGSVGLLQHPKSEMLLDATECLLRGSTFFLMNVVQCNECHLFTEAPSALLGLI